MFTKNIFNQKDGIADLVGNILEADYKNKMEELKGNQHKIDKNKNGKIDSHDFKILRGEKTMQKEAAATPHYTDDIGNQYHYGASGYVSVKNKSGIDQGQRHLNDMSAVHKKNYEKVHGMAWNQKNEEVEKKKENPFDALMKAAKERQGPQPSGGSGMKKGTRYGGSRQKDVKEEVEQVTEISQKLAAKTYNKMADNLNDMKGRTGLAGDQSDRMKDRMTKKWGRDATNAAIDKDRNTQKGVKEEVNIDESIVGEPKVTRNHKGASAYGDTHTRVVTHHEVDGHKYTATTDHDHDGSTFRDIRDASGTVVHSTSKMPYSHYSDNKPLVHTNKMNPNHLKKISKDHDVHAEKHNPDTMGEESEQITELKKSTLLRYTTKANKSSVALGVKAARARDDDDMETWAKNRNKADNRDKNIMRAKRKLSEEEAELEEGSKHAARTRSASRPGTEPPVKGKLQDRMAAARARMDAKKKDMKEEVEDVAEASNGLYQKAIRKHAERVAHDYLGGGDEHLYGANKFDAEMHGVSRERANKDFKTLFNKIVSSQAVSAKKKDVKEGVEHNYTVKRTHSVKEPGELDSSTKRHHYDIHKDGKKVGELEHGEYFGDVNGKLHGKDLPSLGSYRGSHPESKLHSFLNSKTGTKWASNLHKYQKEEAEQIDERTLTKGETAEKERIVKGMKKSLAGFKSRYGDKAKSVMYATATARAKK